MHSKERNAMLQACLYARKPQAFAEDLPIYPAQHENIKSYSKRQIEDESRERSSSL